MQPLESSRHTQGLPLPVSKERKRNSAQWNLQPFCYLCSWSLCSLWSPRWQENSCSEPSSQTLCCLHLLLRWIQSTARAQSASIKDKAGGLQGFPPCIWIPPDSDCTAHCAFQLCSLFPLSCGTALLLSRTQCTCGAGDTQVWWEEFVFSGQVRKIRTEGPNLNPQ